MLFYLDMIDAISGLFSSLLSLPGLKEITSAAKTKSQPKILTLRIDRYSKDNVTSDDNATARGKELKATSLLPFPFLRPARAVVTVGHVVFAKSTLTLYHWEFFVPVTGFIQCS